MSPRQKYLVRKSFAQLEGQGCVAALVFYRKLFEMDPSLRSLFKNDIEAQAEKLMEMLASLLAMLDRSDELESELLNMGQRHANYGVQTWHYAIVGQALIGMLCETLRGEFTTEVREAWSCLYDSVACAMLKGAKQGHGPEV
ncbi:MAG: hemin receptor [Verrucomicrobiae bacterium]|nr:hemin receptor [Verrucomicrobiae bacterium]